MKDRILTLCLVLFVLISILLSYFLLFDINLNASIGNSSSEQGVSEVDQNYYQLAQLTLRDVTAPTKLYYKKGSQYMDVNDSSTLQYIEALLVKDPIELSDSEVENNDEKYQALLSKNHMQIGFETFLPLDIAEYFITVPSNFKSDFMFDSILIPEDGTTTVYLLNSGARSFMTAQLTQKGLKQEFVEAAKKVSSQWIEVQPYQLSNRMVYLPIAARRLLSEVYTLEKIPETLFIQTVFPNSDYVITGMNTANTKSYQNFESTLTINTAQQLMTIAFNTIGNRDNSLEQQRIRESFAPLRKYEYWNKQMRYMGRSENNAVYRRFVNGRPIFSSVNDVDYGATRVSVRETSSAEVYRYQMPMIILQSHIDDISQEYILDAGEVVVAQLEQAGYLLSDVTNILVGYQWQRDMDNFQIATLIPKWYVVIDGRAYALDELPPKTAMMPLINFDKGVL